MQKSDSCYETRASLKPLSMPIAARSPRLFPSFVAQCTVAFDAADSRDLGEQFPGIVLPVSLASAVRKRQIEFAAGRHCAREALRRCAAEVADAPILSGPNREPLWPAGVVGAIAHAQGLATVAVASQTHARGIGVDIEGWIRSAVAQDLAGSIAGPGEVEAIARATGFPFERALTLVFSTKESVFKCLFPQVGRYFDFHDAAVVGADLGRGEVEVELLVTLAPSLRAGDVFVGRFEHDERLVSTGLVAPP